MKRFLLPLILIALAGCERPFELKQKNLPDKLFLECLSGAGDTTFVTLQTCIPVNNGKTVTTVSTDVEKLSLRFGDEEVPLVKYTEKGSKYNRWYSLAPVPDGQTVSVEAKARGAGSVNGQSVIPMTPSVKSLSMKINPRDSSLLDIKLDLDGEGLSYCGVVCQVMSVYEYEGLSDYSVTSYYSEAPEESEDYFNITFNGSSLIDDYTLFGYPYEGMEDIQQLLIPKKSYLEKNGTAMAFSVRRQFFETASHHEPAVYHEVLGFMLSEEHDVTETYRYFYRLRIFSLSPEFYFFAQSRYMQRSNPLSFLGLAPAMAAWSNVSGGFGVVAGCRITETPWTESVRKKDPL